MEKAKSCIVAALCALLLLALTGCTRAPGELPTKATTTTRAGTTATAHKETTTQHKGSTTAHNGTTTENGNLTDDLFVD